MVKANKTILRETVYISVSIGILSIIMQLVFALLGKWNYTALTGNILGAGIMIANFFFMGLSVQKAVEADEKEARKIMKLSQSLRTLMIFVGTVVGVVLSCFSTWATIIPLFFPRVAFAVRPFIKGKSAEKEVSDENEV